MCAEWERQTCHLQQLIKFECTEKHSGAMYRHYIYLIMSWSLIKKIRDPLDLSNDVVSESRSRSCKRAKLSHL